MTAPPVPMSMAFFRKSDGSLLAAMAMTTALSPPSRISSIIMDARAVIKSQETKVHSMMHSPLHEHTIKK